MSTSNLQVFVYRCLLRQQFDDNRLWGGGTFILTDAAPDATHGDYLNAVLDIKPNGRFPDWAAVHAVGAINPLYSQTGIMIYFRQANLNLIDGELLKCTTGTHLHTCQRGTDNAWLGIRVNVGRSGKIWIVTLVNVNSFGGTTLNTISTALAGF